MRFPVISNQFCGNIVIRQYINQLPNIVFSLYFNFRSRFPQKLIFIALYLTGLNRHRNMQVGLYTKGQKHAEIEASRQRSSVDTFSVSIKTGEKLLCKKNKLQEKIMFGENGAGNLHFGAKSCHTALII